ncbi:MAG: sugar phosphate isomerase/epimerase [Clostridia bacterium]|nr:sugar phosphate isomerase/epimerase [Clostridia bacterium]
MKMCLGAQLFTVHKYMTNVEDYRYMMAKIAEIGYKTVQMSGYNKQAITPAIIKEVTEANGLRVVLTHNDLDRVLNDTDRLIEEHNLFNCNAIGIGCVDEAIRSYDGYVRLCEDLAPAIEKIKASGKVFLYHNHRFEFERFVSATTGDVKNAMDLVMSLTDPEGCKLTFDAYWAIAAGVDAADFIRKNGKRIFCTHFKDMAVKNDQVVMTELLTGNINYDAIMAACAEAGIRDLFVEQDQTYIDSIESMKISHDNMKARYDLD